MKDKRILEALMQARDAVEQANKALNDVMRELGVDELDQVTGAGDPFDRIPRPDPQSLDSDARRNA